MWKEVALIVEAKCRVKMEICRVMCDSGACVTDSDAPTCAVEKSRTEAGCDVDGTWHAGRLADA
jgi:hypothetical protein